MAPPRVRQQGISDCWPRTHTGCVWPGLSTLSLSLSLSLSLFLSLCHTHTHSLTHSLTRSLSLVSNPPHPCPQKHPRPAHLPFRTDVAVFACPPPAGSSTGTGSCCTGDVSEATVQKIVNGVAQWIVAAMRYAHTVSSWETPALTIKVPIGAALLHCRSDGLFFFCSTRPSGPWPHPYRLDAVVWCVPGCPRVCARG